MNLHPPGEPVRVAKDLRQGRTVAGHDLEVRGARDVSDPRVRHRVVAEELARHRAGAGAGHVAAADFNGDGLTDLVSGNYVSGDLSVTLGKK